MDRQYMAENLKRLRSGKNATQKDVAAAIGISESAYSQYETGEKVPRDDVKVALSKYFGRSVQYIFFGSSTR